MMVSKTVSGTDLKTFVGSKDFSTSRDFYVAIGWTLNWEQGDLAELQLDHCKFFLQRYYQKAWCNNSMLHLTVNDAHAWHQLVTDVLAQRSFGAARTTAPKLEQYGALVTHVWDPSGVLWHLAQPVDAA
jgi:predicted lactoylglutathione lyase